MSTEPEERKEEYILELLCPEGEPKKVNFTGEACIIGTGPKADVRLSHADLLECVLDYKNNLLRVLAGKVKINGEVITKEMKIHYPCIIEAAERLFRITKVQKEEPEIKEESIQPEIKNQFITAHSKINEREESSSERESNDTNSTFTAEMKDHLFSVEHQTKEEEVPVPWSDIEISSLLGMNGSSLPEEARQMISDFCDGVVDLESPSNDTDKELEPEMHSDDILREQQEKEAQIKNNGEEKKEEKEEKEENSTDRSVNLSRISIFEDITYVNQDRVQKDLPETVDEREDKSDAEQEINNEVSAEVKDELKYESVVEQEINNEVSTEARINSAELKDESIVKQEVNSVEAQVEQEVNNEVSAEVSNELKVEQEINNELKDESVVEQDNSVEVSAESVNEAQVDQQIENELSAELKVEQELVNDAEIKSVVEQDINNEVNVQEQIENELSPKAQNEQEINNSEQVEQEINNEPQVEQEINTEAQIEKELSPEPVNDTEVQQESLIERVGESITESVPEISSNMTAEPVSADIPVHRIRSSGKDSLSPSTPSKLNIPVQPVTPGRSIRRASISHQIQQKESNRRKKPAQKKKKQKK